MIKLLSLFSGIGAFEAALRRGGYQFETVNYCEIDPYAAKAYSQIHGISEDFNLHDVRTVNPLLMNNVNLVTYGFPCVPEGFLIKTKNGYKNIEDITTNDYVLSHTNTYQKVVKTMNRISDHINHVKGVGCVDLQITDEHPVYVLRNNEFMWVKAKDLSLSDRLVFNKNTKTENIDIPDNVLWLMGRYFADGYKENHALHRVIFCIGKKKTFEFEEKIQGIKFTKYHESRSCIEYKLIDSEIEKYFTGFTTRSTEKEIPQWIIDLSKDKLIHFYNGYYSGDGHDRKDRELSMFCTVSKKMAYGLQDIVIKLFNVVPTLNIRKDKRSKTFNDSYCFQFSLRPKEQIIRKDKICVQIKNLYREEKQLKVFNFEVENDNSYTVNNVIVHNCQDISIAGKQKGFEHDGERTRSGLFFEALRIIEFLQPEYAICENVKALTSKKFEKEFNTVLNSLAEVGYNNYWKVLNAKDYGIPQNRERVFIVSIRKDIDKGGFKFPEKMPLNIRVKDILENNVDEKYYINTEKARQLIKKLLDKNRITGVEVCDATVNAPNVRDISNAIISRYDAGISNQRSWGTAVIEPHVKQIGNIVTTGNFKNPQRGRIYDSEGISPCLNTVQGGGLEPKFIEPVICTSRGRNPENPSDRTAGIPTEQRLEPNTDGVSNTLTTVQKDNYLLEVPKLTQIGNLMDDTKRKFKNSQTGRVYDSAGISPAIDTTQGRPKFVEPVVIGSTQEHAAVKNDGICTCLTEAMGAGGGQIPMITDNQQNDCCGYRIRKLTPLECFRLMGFSDEEFNRIKGVSNTQLYKMAGNSIVVNVLEAIFKQLFKENHKE